MLKEYSATDVLAVREHDYVRLLYEINRKIYKEMILESNDSISVSLDKCNGKCKSSVIKNMESKGFKTKEISYGNSVSLQVYLEL